MSKTTTMTVRIPVEVMARLENISRATDRSKAYLASQAIENYVAVQQWQVEAIRDAVSAADDDEAQFLEHKEVEARVKKLISDRENIRK